MTQRTFTYRRAAIAGGLAMLLTACASDPLFNAHLKHCIDAVIAQERGPQMTLRPKGYDKYDYCIAHARNMSVRRR